MGLTDRETAVRETFASEAQSRLRSIQNEAEHHLGRLIRLAEAARGPLPMEKEGGSKDAPRVVRDGALGGLIEQMEDISRLLEMMSRTISRIDDIA